jgi:hypothetical protein
MMTISFAMKTMNIDRLMSLNLRLTLARFCVNAVCWFKRPLSVIKRFEFPCIA